MSLRILIWTLLVFGLLSCTSIDENDLKAEYQVAVNKLLKEKLGDGKILIQLEIKPLHRTMYAGLSDKEFGEKYGYDEMPMYLNKDLLDYFVSANNMDKLTAEYLLSQIDSTKTFELDAHKLTQQVIRKLELKKLFSERGAYGKLESKFGASCFIKLSYPIFNKDKTILVFSLDRTCGPLNGDGTIYLMKKIEGKWNLVDEQETWAS